jgi:hypothetical protein
VPGALLLAISSPYARRGALWSAYRDHFGQDGDALIWQAPSQAMNPTLDPRIIADAYAQDASAARAEYGGEFRRDIESFVDPELLSTLVASGVHERGPVSGISYVAGSRTWPSAIRRAAVAATR